MMNLMKTSKTVLLYILFFTGILSHAQEVKQSPPTYFPKGSLILRTNSLSWLMLKPGLGLEYKVSDNIGLIVDGAFSRRGRSVNDKYWHFCDLAPQVRYYAGEFKYNYLGVQYTMGEYNMTEIQGNYLGGGLTFGHQFDYGHNLSVDVGLSVGYLYLYDTEKYIRTSGGNIRTRDKYSHGYWGLTGASITLVWKIN